MEQMVNGSENGNGYHSDPEGAYQGLILKSSNYDRWKEKQQAEFEAALESLLDEKTPKDAIYKRQGRGNMNFDYVQGWWMIKQLNALFSRHWSWRIEKEEVGQSQVWVRGILTVRIGPGEDGLVSKEAYGGADIKHFGGGNSKGGQVIDIADDLKAASTDALKKAASMIGIAADIYGGHSDSAQSKSGFDPKRFKVLIMRAGNLGMDEEALKEFILTNAEINPEETPMEEMTEGKLNQVLGLLVKMDTAKQKEAANA